MCVCVCVCACKLACKGRHGECYRPNCGMNSNIMNVYGKGLTLKHVHTYLRVSYRIFSWKGRGGGEREKYQAPIFSSYAVNEFTTWKIAPGVYGVLDKIK